MKGQNPHLDADSICPPPASLKVAHRGVSECVLSEVSVLVEDLKLFAGKKGQADMPHVELVSEHQSRY